MEGLAGMPSWRWIFILEGAITVVAAFAGYLLLPNYPSNTSWLSAEETAMAQWRLSREVDGESDEVNESVFLGLKKALSDPKVYVLVLIQTSAVVSMSFTYFFPSIVKTLGYPRVETLLLTAPPYFLAFLFSLANSWHSGRTGEHCFHIVVACLISAVGQIVSMSTLLTGPRYFAMFLQATVRFYPLMNNTHTNELTHIYLGRLLCFPTYSFLGILHYSTTQSQARRRSRIRDCYLQRY